MPTNSLSLTFDELRQRVGKERGYGTNMERWSSAASENVEMIVKDGLRTFYSGSGYEWTFLKPLKNLTIKSASTSLLMPADFGFMVGHMYFDEPAFSRPIMVCGDIAEILTLRQQDTESTGRPQKGAFVVSGEPGATHQQMQSFEFWPESDDDYDIVLRYSVLPDALTEVQQYPYGGQLHAETIKEACLAASEKFDGQPGLHMQLYEKCLQGSIANDRKIKPQSLGWDGNPKQSWGNNPVTYTPTL